MRIKYPRKLTILVISAIMVLASVVAVSAEPVTSTMSRTEMLDLFYPVGCYFETTDGSFNPETAWGGQWSKDTDGRVLISESSTHTLGETGGEETHVLTPAETAIRNHTHTMAHTHTMGHTHPMPHTHSIPALSGTAASAGAHTHKGYYRTNASTGGSGDRIGHSGSYTKNNITTTLSAGAHTHSVTTNASTTGGSSAANTGASSAANTGGSSAANTGNPTEANGAAHNNMQPYKVVVRWHRDA